MSRTGLEKICLSPNFVYVYVVWIQYTNVTDGRTDRRTRPTTKTELTHSVVR